MSRRASSAVSTESRFSQPHISRMMWRPMAFIDSPPPQDYGRDSAANPFDLVLDRANDDLFQVQAPSGEPFVDHLAYRRFHLVLGGAVRLVNHPMGPFRDTDADRGGHGIAGTRGYVHGVDRRYQRAGRDLWCLLEEEGILR